MKDEKYWTKRDYKRLLYLLWQFIFGLPKSFIFNIKYLGLRGLKLPVILSYKVKLKKMSGKVIIPDNAKFASIKLGFTAAEVFDNRKLSLIWINDGIVKFNGSAGIHNGMNIRVYGKLVFGNSFHSSSTGKIICYKQIVFGEDVLLGWDVEIVDGDAHKIYINNSYKLKQINPNKDIFIGNRVWIGSNCKIFKGSMIGNDIVIAANSIITKPITNNNCIIGGNPIRIIKEDIYWKV